MEVQPRVSVLIPIYNGIEYLSKCLTGLDNQSFKNFETLIGLNGMNDKDYKKSIETINKFKRIMNIRVFKYDIANKPRTMNLLKIQSKGKWICILDVDDIWLYDKLEKQLTFIDNHNFLIDAVGTHCYYIDKQNKPIGAPDIPIGTLNYNKKTWLNKNCIINSSAMVKRDYFHYDVIYFEGVDDYHMWITLIDLNAQIYNLPQHLVLHRIHNNSAFNSKKQDIEGLRKFWRKRWGV